MAGEITIRGGKELAIVLQSIPARMEKRVMQQALLAGARVIRDRAKVLAPRRTGATRRNIIAKRGRPRGGYNVRALVGVRHGRAKSYVDVYYINRALRLKGLRGTRKLSRYDRRGEDPFYYRFQEFGYTAVGRSKRGNRRGGRRVPGKFFLTAAYRQSSLQAVKVTGERAEVEMRKAFARIQGGR